jgi:hypothetical protein
MADTNVVKGQMNPNTAGSPYNSLQFIIDQAIRGKVNTAIVVKVTKVSGQYVDVLPLVTQVDGFGKAIAPTQLFHLPFMRYHAGIASVILDPVVGDIGLAVFAQKDCSNVKQGTSEPQIPASFRTHSMANGFYIGGFLNRQPTTYVELKQSGEIVITAPNGLTINGDVTTNGNISINGSQTLTGDCTASGISLANHIHTGDSGGKTSPPIGG